MRDSPDTQRRTDALHAAALVDAVSRLPCKDPCRGCGSALELFRVHPNKWGTNWLVLVMMGISDSRIPIPAALSSSCPITQLPITACLPSKVARRAERDVGAFSPEQWFSDPRGHSPGTIEGGFQQVGVPGIKLPENWQDSFVRQRHFPRGFNPDSVCFGEMDAEVFIHHPLPRIELENRP